MTKHVSVEIDEQMDVFIGQQISHGQYGSPSEVIAAALKLLRHQAELEAIADAIKEGEESGEPQDFDGAEFLKEMHRKYAR
ncbi:type II toxin-antitoxin system ParD family antitoxin [Rhizobium sp. P40RR-XXII]|uniref:type II toxin-antitoxin system ParD family antitoxin n=1 Tax=unclassified Rhizobium TaxID=2613769 RepID=UPI001456360F|nr:MULTISPECIES: type II toxin-antitoxin system ParD family antitoxin [unclassified Rhizobium]NLR85081.1 type II toxin-antitoxin system ParD family antitoxin [Rhizobium sp. P28RR-XV]NLS16943.1 type II toxin-antitoxin system ParD family antitoxin [Rhizobium sp. P40RR-XXII]